MSLTFTSESNLRSQDFFLGRGTYARFPSFSFSVLLLTLSAVAADQFAAPALYSSSPLWAVVACTALVCGVGGEIGNNFGGNRQAHL